MMSLSEGSLGSRMLPLTDRPLASRMLPLTDRPLASRMLIAAGRRLRTAAFAATAFMTAGCATITLDEKVSNLAKETRLNDIAYELTRAAAPFCPAPAADLGIRFARANWVRADVRDTWRGFYGLDDEIRAFQVRGGSPAQVAGVPAGASVLSVGELTVNRDTTQRDIDAQIQAGAAGSGRVRLVVADRAKAVRTFDLRPDRVCPVNFTTVYLQDTTLPGFGAGRGEARVVSGTWAHVRTRSDFAALASHGVAAAMSSDPRFSAANQWLLLAGSGVGAAVIGPFAALLGPAFMLGNSDQSRDIAADTLGLILIARAGESLPGLESYEQVFGAFERDARRLGPLWNRAMTPERREALKRTLAAVQRLVDENRLAELEQLLAKPRPAGAR